MIALWRGVYSKYRQGDPLLAVIVGSLSLGLWWVLLSFWAALLLTVTQLFHELGHVWALRRQGVRVHGISAMPLGFATVYEKGRYPGAFWFVWWGPLFGGATTLPAIGLYLATGDPVYAGVAGFIAALHGAQLFPAKPLDGGKLRDVLLLRWGYGTRLLGVACLTVGMAVWYMADGWWVLLIPLAILGIELNWTFRNWLRTGRYIGKVHNPQAQTSFAYWLGRLTAYTGLTGALAVTAVVCWAQPGAFGAFRQLFGF